MKRKLFSLFLAICMMLSLIPVTAFAVGENNGKLTFKCQSNAGNGGQIWYQLNCTGDFVQVTTTESGDGYEPISLTSESGDVSGIAIKFVPSEGYKLDTTRGVSLSVNGTKQFNTQNGDNIADFTGESGHTFTFTSEMLGNDKTVSTSSFELEFGFERVQTQDPQDPQPAGENGKLGFGGIDASRGKIEYKFNENDGFTAVGTTDSESRTTYNSVELGENSSITVKISPAVKTASTEGYRIDTVKGVSLRKNGEEDASYKDSALDALMGENEDGSVYYTLTFALSEVAQSNFELDFNYENDNFTDGGGRPHGEDNYLGTIKKTKLTITGDVNVCINDSILINKNGAASEKNDIQYHYNGGTVDFYIQCHLTQRYTAITINGKDYYSQLPTPGTEEGRKALLDACKGQINEFKLTVPYSKDGYEVSASIKELDESDKDYWQVGNFLWRYDWSENEDDLIKNGKMELINVVYSDTTYELKDLTNEESGFHWKEDENGNGGEAVLPAGATVTVKIVPDAGYQLTSFSVNGFGFGTGKDPSVFTFEVEQGNFHLGAKITQVGDEVKSGTDTVKSGEVYLGSNTIDSGSVILSVNNSATNTSEFSKEGYEINSVLDINLNQVWYKGTLEDYWEKALNNLESAVDITLDLAENFEEVVILHKHGEGVEEIKPTLNNGKLSFKTNSFSDFALAVKAIDPEQGGCFLVGYNNRGDGNSVVKAKIGDADEFTASPDAWSKWYQYSNGSQTINFTVTVPEDRAGETPIIEANLERTENRTETSKRITPNKISDGTYSFSITPNTLFADVENPSIVFVINWSDFDMLSPGDGEFVVHTVNLIDENGTVDVMGAMKRVEYKTLGNESKYIYEQAPGELHVIFKPGENKELCGFRVINVDNSETEYGFENGKALPKKQSDGSYDFTLNISGTEKEIIIEALFIDCVEQVAKPVISPNGGTFTGSQTVEITCDTADADIFYTLDGTTPTTRSERYTAPFTISEDTTVKAIAVKADMEDSEVVVAAFTKKSSSGGTGGSGGSSGGSGGSSGGSSTPSNPTVDGKEQTWTDVASDIEKLPEGTTETISLNGNNTVPADVVKAIAASNAEVTLKVDSVFSWTIDGSDIDEEDAKAANLTITKTTVVADNTPRGTEGTSFSVKGTNVKSQLNINFKATHSGEFANLYKKVDGKLVFVDNVKIDENGAAIGLDVSEKGEYVVMLGEFSDRAGDMDNDGVMNSKDALAVIKDFLGIENGANPLVSDLNGDGYINSKDALIIIEKFLGIE